MFDRVDEAVAYIEAKRTKRMFFDFQKIITKYQLNTNLKNIIHVAGTNGKGSTTVFMRDLLMKQGYHVGTFTSPYIINHNERISVDGKSISDEDLLRIINQLYKMIEVEQLSMFEIDVCIMLVYFSRLQLDYHIIECGIGGLYDKTNVLDCEVAVITNIGMDHQFMLGNTLLEIAQHKAGIIKKEKPLFTAETDAEILAYFQGVCQNKNSAFFPVDTAHGGEYPYCINLKGKEYFMAFPEYQVYNFLLAYHVINYFHEVQDDCVRDVLKHFFWPCRFEKIGHCYLDGAHNVPGMKALLQTLNSQKLDDIGIVFSALNDKDVGKMLDMLKDYDVIFASFTDERSDQKHMSFIRAIALMEKKHRNVVITGSLHFVSAVRKYLLTR